MSDITLSSGIRANLLSLQSTAQLLETTQNHLSTGKKVNSALDNPVNFFTASGLDSRAGDISNLLDTISNGVQALQAANTGITSLTNLVSTAKSIAQQALQAPIAYSTKSNVSTTIGGATATDLRGTTTYANATANSNALVTGTGAAIATAGTTTLDSTAGTLVGTQVKNNNTTSVSITSATLLYDAASGTSDALAAVAGSKFTNGTKLTVNGHTITFEQGATQAAANALVGTGFTAVGTTGVSTDGKGNSVVYLGSSATTSTGTVGDLMSAIDLASGVGKVNVAGTAVVANTNQTLSSITAGVITLDSSTTSALNVTGTQDQLLQLGLSAAGGSGSVTLSAAPTAGATNLNALLTDGSTLTVNGKTITFSAASRPATVPTGSGTFGNTGVTDGNGNSTVYLQGGTVDDVLKAIDLATGVQTAAIASGVATLSTTSGDTNSSVSATGTLKISTGTTADLDITGTGNALAALGLNGNTGTATSFTASRTAGAGSISGKTLTFTAFNGGTAVNVTFGDGTGGTVKTLDQLNTVLNANNMIASVDTTGKLTISASNDYASSTLGSAAAGGSIGGTISTALTWSVASAPVADVNATATRTNLVSQYNNIMSQITTTAQDSSFNGINLLNGDQLKLTFNETATSTLTIKGVTFNTSGLALSNLTAGTDFLDNSGANKVIASLDTASSTLRTQASAFGSNLSVVQTRQDFNKNLINVLQTGSSNLTLADTNLEGANMLALQTRQQLATTSLSLSAQADQAVLRLFG
jgi:flagellin